MGHREDLLVGARRCLEERGYAHTTARDLVAASGTNLASIGYHFGSKEALLNAALRESFQEWAERVRELVLAAEPVDGPGGVLAAAYSAIVASFAEYRGLAVAFTEALARSARQAELRADLAETYRRSRAQVAAMIGELTGLSATQADTLASFELALCDGLLVQWLLDPDRLPAAADLVDSLAAVLTQGSLNR